MHRTILACCVLLLATGPADAREVYKWVDGKGKVHYGDRPEGAKSRKLDVPASTPDADASSAARDERTRKLLDQYAEERSEADEAKAKRQQDDAKRKENCRLAKDILEDYRTASYLYDKGKDGERVVLSKEQRAEAEAEAKEAVATWCKPAP